ncbi:MAG: protein kinase [Anaerolineae bacterium]
MNDHIIEQEIIKGRYRLETPLGSGGMGVVYRAWDRLTHTDVAFKKVQIDKSSDYLHLDQTIADDYTMGDLRLSLAQEFQTVATLRHPNIISVLDYGFDDNKQPWFTMELIENGQNLLEATQNKSLSAKVDLVAQMIRAIAYLHRRGITHCDLKPDNVVVTNDAVKILDFGLASTRERIESTNEISGTIGYLAPEILRGEVVDSAVDYYAVGVMLYEMLLGERYYPSYNLGIVYRHVLTHEPIISDPAIPPGLAELIYSLTSKNPKTRLTDPVQIINRLAPYSTKTKLHVETTATRESFLQAARFVGREDELTLLTTALSSASEGHGSAWLIGGESGVGKSRLVSEIRVRAMMDGALVLHGQGVEDSQGLPYEIWRETVSQLLLLDEPDHLTAGVLKAILPGIEQLLEVKIPQPPQLDGSAARQRIYSTVTNLFDRKQGWTLLILEDLQWDQNNLDILIQLNRVVHKYKLMILATYRSDERPDLPNRLQNMNYIQLQRFSTHEISVLSHAMLGPVAQSEPLQQMLENETEGNAFFLIELVRELAEVTGGLAKIDPADLPEKLLPKGIATIIERRLERVPVKARKLLKYAAISGRQPDPIVLEKIATQISLPYTLVEWLSLCSDAAVLETFNGVWRFSHDKIREGLVSALTTKESVEYHHKMAETIEDVYPNDASQAAILTHHWHMAGDLSRERIYAGQAGEFARNRFLNEDAIDFYSRAIELTPDDRALDVFDLLLSMEDIQHLLADRTKQEISIDRLKELADVINTIGGPDVLNEARLRLGRFQIARGQFQNAIETSQSILESQIDESSSIQIEAFRQLGEASMSLGDYDQSIAILQKLIGITKKKNQRLMMAEGLQQMGETMINSKRFDDARPYLIEAQQTYKKLKLRQKEARVFNNIGIVAQAQGKISEAIRYWATCQKIYQAIGDRLGNAKILTNLCALNLDVGDFDLAVRYGKEGLRICQEICSDFGECLNLLNLAIIHLYLDEYELSEIYCHASIFIAKNINNPHLIANANRELGLILTYINRLDEAEDAYNQVLEITDEIDQPILAFEVKAELAHLYLRRGENKLAEEIIGPLLEFVADEDQLDAAIHPFRMYSICYLMMLLTEHEFATDILLQAYDELMIRAGRIEDPSKRKLFLENIIEHRQIVNAYEAISDRLEMIL